MLQLIIFAAGIGIVTSWEEPDDGGWRLTDAEIDDVFGSQTQTDHPNPNANPKAVRASSIRADGLFKISVGDGDSPWLEAAQSIRTSLFGDERETGTDTHINPPQPPLPPPNADRVLVKQVIEVATQQAPMPAEGSAEWAAAQENAQRGGRGGWERKGREGLSEAEWAAQTLLEQRLEKAALEATDIPQEGTAEWAAAMEGRSAQDPRESGEGSDEWAAEHDASNRDMDDDDNMMDGDDDNTMDGDDDNMMDGVFGKTKEKKSSIRADGSFKIQVADDSFAPNAAGHLPSESSQRDPPQPPLPPPTGDRVLVRGGSAAEAEAVREVSNEVNGPPHRPSIGQSFFAAFEEEAQTAEAQQWEVNTDDEEYDDESKGTSYLLTQDASYLFAYCPLLT
jgi:hypothetical protein